MRSLALAPLLLVTLGAASARAQSNSSARAEALFEEAKALMSKGDYTHACPKFAASEKLDPGVGTLLNLGTCYERQGKTASAWAAFTEAASQAHRAGEPERVRFAEKHANDLLKKLAHLVIRVGDQRAALEVKLDGTVVDTSEWGSPLPVDPGPHTVEVSSPGKRSWSTSVDVGQEPTQSEVAVPVLADEAPTTPPEVHQPLVAEVEPPPAPPTSSPLRPIGIVVGVVGLIGVGVGLGFGLDAVSKNNDAMTHCPMSPACNDQTGVDLTKQAQASALAATVAVIAGGVVFATGLTLVLVAPHKRSAVTAHLAPLVGPGLGGAAIGGSF